MPQAWLLGNLFMQTKFKSSWMIIFLMYEKWYITIKNEAFVERFFFSLYVQKKHVPGNNVVMHAKYLVCITES